MEKNASIKTGTRSKTGSARTSTGILLIRVLTYPPARPPVRIFWIMQEKGLSSVPFENPHRRADPWGDIHAHCGARTDSMALNYYFECCFGAKICPPKLSS